MPNGFSGVLTGAAIVFFTYIGFDSVSTAAEECRNPQRDLPFGIIATLVICTVLYVSVSLVLTGIANYSTLNNAAPVAGALKALGYDGIRHWVERGRVGGNALLAAGLSIRPGAGLVRHVARRPAAASVFESPSGLSGRRTSAPGSPAWWSEYPPASGISAPSPTFQHRHAVRLYCGVGWSDRAAEDAAGPASRLSRSRRARVAAALDCCPAWC